MNISKLVWIVKIEVLHAVGLHSLTVRELSVQDRLDGYSEACCPKSGV